MLTAVGFGTLAAASLILGGGLGLLRKWPDGLIGGVLGFGAGALIASVSFELAEEGVNQGGPLAVVVGLAAGAACFYLANKAVSRVGGRTGSGGAGSSLALGALLDGIPEQLVLGIGLAQGHGVSLALLVAIFVSNLPESIGSSADMSESGQSKGRILALWAGVTVVCAGATVAGFALADATSAAVKAGINGFAAGALLVMLVDSMVPEAKSKAKDKAGLLTVVGFALAAGLSLLG